MLLEQYYHDLIYQPILSKTSSEAVLCNPLLAPPPHVLPRATLPVMFHSHAPGTGHFLVAETEVEKTQVDDQQFSSRK